MGLGSISSGPRGPVCLWPWGLLLAGHCRSRRARNYSICRPSARRPTFRPHRRHPAPDIGTAASAPAPPPPRGPALQSLPPPATTRRRHRGALAIDRHGSVDANARYGPNLPQITGGLHWRIYPVKPDQGGAYRPLKEDRGAAPVFSLPPGSYVVHVGFGLASAMRTVQLRADGARETFEIPAGGLRIKAGSATRASRRDRSRSTSSAAASSSPATAAPIVQSVASRRRDPGAGRLLSHRLALRRRQLGGALRHPRADRQADRRHRHPSRRNHHAQAGQPVRRRSARQYPVVGAHARRRRGQGIDRRLPARDPGGRRIPRHRAQRRPEQPYERTFRVVTGVDTEVEVLAR